jgi:hypothetical protein
MKPNSSRDRSAERQLRLPIATSGRSAPICSMTERRVPREARVTVELIELAEGLPIDGLIIVSVVDFRGSGQNLLPSRRRHEAAREAAPRSTSWNGPTARLSRRYSTSSLRPTRRRPSRPQVAPCSPSPMWRAHRRSACHDVKGCTRLHRSGKRRSSFRSAQAPEPGMGAQVLPESVPSAPESGFRSGLKPRPVAHKSALRCERSTHPRGVLDRAAASDFEVACLVPAELLVRVVGGSTDTSYDSARPRVAPG